MPFTVEAVRLPEWNRVHYILWAIVPAEGVLEADSVVARFDDGTRGKTGFEKGNWLVPMGMHHADASADQSVPPPPADPKQWEEMHRSAVLVPFYE